MRTILQITATGGMLYLAESREEALAVLPPRQGLGARERQRVGRVRDPRHVRPDIQSRPDDHPGQDRSYETLLTGADALDLGSSPIDLLAPPPLPPRNPRARDPRRLRRQPRAQAVVASMSTDERARELA